MLETVIFLIVLWGVCLIVRIAREGSGLMGQCRYCAQDAGWFSREHGRCRQQHETAMKQMRAACVAAATTGRGNEQLLSTLETLAENGRVDPAKIRPTMIKAWGDALEKASPDMILGRDQHRSLAVYKSFHRLSQTELARFGFSHKMHQIVLLRSLIEDGAIPEYNPMRTLVGTKPRALFALMRSESLLWVFPKAEYLTEVSQRHYSAGTSGFSFRVADGVTWRVGQSRGRSFTTESMQVVDSGIVGVSTKHIYWAGQRGFGKSKSFRIRLNRIVSVEMIKDGVALMRDAQSAKPEAFRGFDGRFATLLIMAAGAALDEGGFTMSERKLDDMADDAGIIFTAGSDIGVECPTEIVESDGGD